MSSHKINKKNAMINASKQLVYDNASDIIDPLVVLYPTIGIPLKMIQYSYGYRVAYKQEELNQFTEHLMANTSIYTERVIDSKDFRDGLITFMDDYLKMRGETKLKLARAVFDDFTKSNNMPLYPLERYDDTLLKISEAGLRFLVFIENDVPRILNQYPSSDIGYTHMPKYLSTFFDRYTSHHPEKQEEINLLINEMEQLGIITRALTPTTFELNTDTSNVYDLTHYGRQFITIIAPEINNQFR